GHDQLAQGAAHAGVLRLVRHRLDHLLNLGLDVVADGVDAAVLVADTLEVQFQLVDRPAALPVPRPGQFLLVDDGDAEAGDVLEGSRPPGEWDGPVVEGELDGPRLQVGPDDVLAVDAAADLDLAGLREA